MEYFKTEDGMLTLLLAATVASVITVALAFYNAFQNVSYTAGF